MSDDHPESQSQSHRGDVPGGLQRRDFLLASGSVLAAAASSPTAATMAQAQAQPAPAPASGQKPNVVFILVDNTGWGDLRVYGGTVPTPRIDALARDGIRLNNYTVEAQCTPTRSARRVVSLDWHLKLHLSVVA